MKRSLLAKIWRATKVALRRGGSHTNISGSAGRIIAEPNPLPSDLSAPASLRWETKARKVEIHLSKNGQAAKVISRCGRRSFDTTRLQAGTSYLFQLYETTGTPRLLHELAVTRECKGQLHITGSPLVFPGKVLLQWEITAPALAELRVSEEEGPERVVTAGASGTMDLEWARPWTSYVFRLYHWVLNRPASGYQLLDELRVRWGDDMTSRQLAGFVTRLASHCLYDKDSSTWFSLWEEHGFHITPVHYYSPIPHLQSLNSDIWTRSELVGIDLNPRMQRYFLQEVFPRFRSEYERLPKDAASAEGGFYLNNGRFEGSDPLITYCMVRHFKPRQIIEVGGGYSTLLLEQAAKENGMTHTFTIEPYPEEILRDHMSHLIEKKVEDVELSYFQGLERGDFLFIDSSHVVRTGGDVNFLFLEVLPRLQPGVLVHIHDIFFPHEYPRDWITRERRFWTEQYLLQAFLAFNYEFEVLVSSAYLQSYHSAELEEIFPLAKPWHGGSFWMQRKQSHS